MLKKYKFRVFVLLLSLTLICPNGYSISLSCANVGAKVANPRSNPRIFLRDCNPSPPPQNNGFTAGKKKQHERSLGRNLVMPQQASSQQVNSNNMYQHQLDGEWDYVVGHFGFFHEFPEVGNAFVSIFGARTTPNGNGTHNTNEWDRKAFWFDVGDGVPMHLGAEYYVEYIDPEDESFSVIVYNAYNLLYRQNGKDYSQTEFGGEWIYLELYTDLNSDYIDYSILLLDENDEVVEVRKFELGDQVEAWTAVYKLDEPESVYVTSMEEDFRMIQSEPVFMYEHMTPNVDFPNALTQDIVDFPNVELKLALFGVNLQDNAATPFQFSSVKDVGVKWDGAIVTGIVNWVLHWFE